jgi:predicted DNA-binding antitoxin AbrB/MazE fold protein
MPTKVRAVYSGGVLRPEQPLPFAEGETVEVVVSKPTGLEGLSPEHAAAVQRVAEANTIQEWIAASEELTKFEPDDGYDVVEEMDKYRRETGQAPLIPRPGDEDYR